METWITSEAWTAIYEPEINPRTGTQDFTWEEVKLLAPEVVWCNDAMNLSGLNDSNAGVSYSLDLWDGVECESFSVTKHPRRPGQNVIVEWPYWEECPSCTPDNVSCGLCHDSGHVTIYTGTDTYAVAYLLGRRDAINEPNN